MNNDTISKALIEVEKNLKNLASARTQVNSISEKSEILIAEVAKLISKVNILQNEFDKEKSELNEHVTQSIAKFQSSLQRESDIFIIKSKDISSSYAASTSDNINILKEFQEKIKVAEESIASLDYEKGLADFKKDTNTKFDSLSTNFSNSINTLKIEQQYSHSDLVKILKNQKKELAKLKAILFIIIAIFIVGFSVMFLMFK